MVADDPTRFTRIRVPDEEAADGGQGRGRRRLVGRRLRNRALAPYVTGRGGARSSMVRAGRS